MNNNLNLNKLTSESNLMVEKIGKIVNKTVSLTDNIVCNNDFNVIYNTNSDFSRMKKDRKRLLILGCSGSGKSTLLNRLAGYSLSWDEKGEKLIWDRDPPFSANHGTNSLTKTTCYANIKTPESTFFKDLIVIDTMGHDDPNSDILESKTTRNKISEQACDLYTKLKRMEYLNTIIILHNDIASNRLNSATSTLLVKLDQMFEKSDKNIWDHVVIVYSKCDSDSIGWKDDLENKKIELRKQLKHLTSNCTTEIPILTLSGLELPSNNIEPYTDLSNIYNFINYSDNFSTNKISKFDGLHSKLEKIISEKDYYCRISKVRQDFITITFYFLIFVGLLCCRNLFLPFLDLNTIIDELVYFSSFIYIIGPLKFLDWLFISWDDHIIPYLKRKELISPHSNLYLLGYLKEC